MKKWKQLENCQQLCSQVVVIFFNLTSIGKSYHKWNQACDKRLARLFLHPLYVADTLVLRETLQRVTRSTPDLHRQHLKRPVFTV